MREEGLCVIGFALKNKRTSDAHANQNQAGQNVDLANEE